ncbi:MAG: lysozyme inhibitor LprI family protein [Chthoniobacterales bacterium]
MKLLVSDKGKDDMKRFCQRLMRAVLKLWTCRLTLLALALMGSRMGLSAKESIDTNLNSTYEKLIKEHGNDVAFISDLRNWERAWVSYRDARANLEAWIVGKTKPDEPARRATVEKLTDAQLQALRQLAADGSPFDPNSLSANPKWEWACWRQYNYYREQVVGKFTYLTGPWILAQKAWLGYLGETETFLESHGPGTKGQLSQLVSNYVDEMRANDLDQLAGRLGLIHYEPKAVSKDSITDWRDDLTVISAKQDLRVEFTDVEVPVAIANADNSRQQLANANPGDTSKGNTYGSDLFISPDSRWILQITWRVHTNREKRLIDAFLYQVIQITPLHLQRYPARESFGDLAMSLFHVPDDSYADIHFVEWKPDALVMAFTVRPDVEPHLGDDGVDWQYEFDLRKHTFTNPARMPGASRLIDD